MVLLAEEYNLKLIEHVNFLDFYAKHKDRYKYLFPKFGLQLKEGESIDKKLWEISHLYKIVAF